MGLNPETLARIRAAAINALPSTQSTISENQNVPSNSVQSIQSTQSQTSASGKAALSESVAALQAIASKPVQANGTKDSLGQGNPSAGTATQIRFQQVSDKILDLETAIKTAHPQMPVLLNEIWKTLITYPECVTLLSEEQIEEIVSGLEKQTDVDLANITVKSATKGKKSGPVSASDLGF